MPDVSVVVARATPGGASVGESRIIGIELRLVDPARGIREEVALVPCDVRYPVMDPRYPELELTLTIHTSRGDVNLPGCNLRLPR